MQDADYSEAQRTVHVVLDHEDGIMAIFATWEAADIYIRREWSDLPGPILWHAEAYAVLTAEEMP